MRRALIDKHLFDAQFEIEIALGPAGRGDIAYVSQCLARANRFHGAGAPCAQSALLREREDAFIENARFALRPDNFHRAVERILGSIGNSPDEMARSAAAMRAITDELRGFCAEKCPPS